MCGAADPLHQASQVRRRQAVAHCHRGKLIGVGEK